MDKQDRGTQIDPEIHDCFRDLHPDLRDLQVNDSEKVRGELNRRGLIPETDWRRVQRNRVRPGMRECSLLAAWGAPNNIIARTQADVDKVFVYDRKDRRTEVLVSDSV